ncbi:FAD-dependent oxidoreductase [Candidatus Uhrbacteria bacterium]|nr:FAD-dependent oxidoreductase [Candidatus Uhrbacteria bacterium]
MTTKTMSKSQSEHSLKRPRRALGSFHHPLYDVCIIGAGAAGLCAGIFSARRGLSTLILGSDLGGQTASTAEIENYPGCRAIEGPDLIREFYEEALRFGCLFSVDRIGHIKKSNGGFSVGGTLQEYVSKTVIVATGKSPRMLGVPGEDSFIGHGIVYGGAFDPIGYKGKRVVIVGGGNSAMDAAARLAGYASQITVVHRRDGFTGEAILRERVERISDIDCRFGSRIISLGGSQCLESVEIESGDASRRVLQADALIVAIGFEARNEWFAGILACSSDGRIIVDSRCRTNCEGIFAAGDCTTVPYQQIVISAGEGAKAALSAYRYVAKNDGRRPVQVDWGYIQ